MFLAEAAEQGREKRCCGSPDLGVGDTVEVKVLGELHRGQGVGHTVKHRPEKRKKTKCGFNFSQLNILHERFSINRFI